MTSRQLKSVKCLVPIALSLDVGMHSGIMIMDARSPILLIHSVLRLLALNPVHYSVPLEKNPERHGPGDTGQNTAAASPLYGTAKTSLCRVQGMMKLPNR